MRKIVRGWRMRHPNRLANRERLERQAARVGAGYL